MTSIDISVTVSYHHERVLISMEPTKINFILCHLVRTSPKKYIFKERFCPHFISGFTKVLIAIFSYSVCV